MNIQEKFFTIRSASHHILSVLFQFYFASDMYIFPSLCFINMIQIVSLLFVYVNLH